MYAIQQLRLRQVIVILYRLDNVLIISAWNEWVIARTSDRWILSNMAEYPFCSCIILPHRLRDKRKISWHMSNKFSQLPLIVVSNSKERKLLIKTHLSTSKQHDSEFWFDVKEREIKPVSITCYVLNEIRNCYPFPERLMSVD